MSTKSITKPEQRWATHADILAVIDAASASIAGLELRIQALEGASHRDTDSSQVPQITGETPADSDGGGDSEAVRARVREIGEALEACDNTIAPDDVPLHSRVPVSRRFAMLPEGDE